MSTRGRCRENRGEPCAQGHHVAMHTLGDIFSHNSSICTINISTKYRGGQSPRLLRAHGGSLTDHPYGYNQSVASEGKLEDTTKVPQLGGAECQHLKKAKGFSSGGLI